MLYSYISVCTFQSVHIDNGRDLGNKVLHLTFKGGRNAEDLHVLKQYDVESRFAGWVTCFIDNDLHNYVKIEAKGPDNTLRLRQVKVLGYVEAPMQVCHSEENCYIT